MPSPQYALHFCHLVAQSQSREKMGGGASEKFHLPALQSSPEKSIWHRLVFGFEHFKLNVFAFKYIDEIFEISDVQIILVP